MSSTPRTPASSGTSSTMLSPHATPRQRVESEVNHLGDIDDGSTPVPPHHQPASPDSVFAVSSLATGAASALGKGSGGAASADSPTSVVPVGGADDIENQAPVAVEEDPATDKALAAGASGFNRKKLGYILCCLLLILAIVIPVTVTQRDRESADRDGVSGVDGGTDVAGDAPTTSPSLSPTMEPNTASPTSTPSPTVGPTTAEPTSMAPVGPPTDEPTAVPTTMAPTDIPSAVPTFTPPTAAPVTLRPTIVGGDLLTLFATVTPVEILRNPATPQHEAWQWLLGSGNLGGADTDEALIQRYALVTMSFSLQPGQQFGTLRTAPRVSECLWNGITCNQNNTAITAVRWPARDLNGRIPDEVAVLSSLQVLDIGENEVVGALPERLFDTATLRELFVQQNQLTGTLSESFAKLEELDTFYGGENVFTGPFPEGLGSPSPSSGSARPLRRLSLYKNSLTGRIPGDLNLRSLEYLDLGFNDLVGPLPYSWGDKMRSLKHMYIDHNRFTGEIPNSWPRINGGRIQTYHFNDNQLTGYVPYDYESLGIMQSIEMQNNNLMGFDRDFCNMLVLVRGETTNFRTDCDICSCNVMCDEMCGLAFGRNP